MASKLKINYNKNHPDNSDYENLKSVYNKFQDQINANRVKSCLSQYRANFGDLHYEHSLVMGCKRKTRMPGNFDGGFTKFYAKKDDNVQKFSYTPASIIKKKIHNSNSKRVLNASLDRINTSQNYGKRFFSKNNSCTGSISNLLMKTPLTEKKGGKKTFNSSFEIQADIFSEEYHETSNPSTKLRKSVDMSQFSDYAGSRVNIPEHRVYTIVPGIRKELSHPLITDGKINRSQSSINFTKKSTKMTLMRNNSSGNSMKLNNGHNNPSHLTTRTQSFII